MMFDYYPDIKVIVRDPALGNGMLILIPSALHFSVHPFFTCWVTSKDQARESLKIG